MSEIMDPALTLGARQPYVRGERAFAERIRMILETRPGTLPWRPDFGCDLDDLIGQPATVQRIGEARWRVEHALRRWLPEVKVNSCQVQLSRAEGGGEDVRRRDVPMAESALLALGMQATLEVLLDVETPAGPLSLQAIIET